MSTETKECVCKICTKKYDLLQTITTECCNSPYCKTCYNNITSYVLPSCTMCGIRLARSTNPNPNFAEDLEISVANNKNIEFFNVLHEFDDSKYKIVKIGKTNNNRSITPPNERTRTYNTMEHDPIRQEPVYQAAAKKRNLAVKNNIVIEPLNF
jgi:hypothetical protein